MSNAVKDDCSAFDVTFSFSAGGWFQMYHYGAAQAIVDCGILNKLAAEGKRVRFSGCSAGSLAALALASGLRNFEDIRDFALTSGEHYRSSWKHFFYMKFYLESAVKKFCKHLESLEEDKAMLKRLNDGSLEIFATTLPKMQKKVLTQFYTYDDLVEAVMASCCMTPLVGVPFRLRSTGEWVCDGAVVTITPRKNEPRTITVSPFYFSSTTVHPASFVPVWWGLCPPAFAAHKNIFTLGYNDTIEGLVMNSYLSPEEGTSLLREEIQFEFERNFLLRLYALMIDCLVLIFIRPVIVTIIYMELAVMSVYHFFSGVTALRIESRKKFYDDVRNMISLRTLGRLFFSSKVPHNKQRLERSSRVYRVFDPIVLGGRKKSERDFASPACSPSVKGAEFPNSRQNYKVANGVVHDN